MTRDELLGLVRQAATILGTVLAGRGIISQGEVEALIGLALIVVSAAWSIWAKRQVKRQAAEKIAEALRTPPPENLP